MICKIDHSDPESIPEFLCAVCHPRKPAAETSATDLSARLAAEDRLTRFERELAARRIELDATSARAPKRRAKLELEIGKLCDKIAQAM